ncbi:YkgJ family cysteine cluster protein [Rhodoferax sp.]|uniref:YkgJ family cysteine cluster protein n=1 Tax=Rhodoferax sp. TaxID=50421 RepID=UPI002637DA40|nr:YkgJ family cysteine cluster protein [Rhodoferax sp.]MDD2926813.1 YkgJ family cysteine cluster protein [Rhodoferax sp.]
MALGQDNSAPMNTSAAVSTSAKVEAGDFGTWLAQMLASFRGPVGTDVPCGSCRGCCTSSYFIHVRPSDRKTLGVVPKNLLSPAPGLPQDHKLIGFTANGACALLKNGDCTIYSSRPQTCRDYDCRVFAAAAIQAGGVDKAAINQRVQEWQFSYASGQDQQIHQAIKKAAAFITRNRAAFPGGRAPVMPSDIAVLAIKVHGVFLQPESNGQTPAELAAAIVQASRAFDASRLTDTTEKQ